MVLSSLLRSRATRIGIGLYFLASLLCTHVPLLNYLGYEFCVVTSLLASAFSGFLSISFVKRTLAATEAAAERRAAGLSAFAGSLAASMTLLVIPLVVMLTNALFVMNCSVIQGFGLYLVIPVVSVVFSVSLGFFCAVYFLHSRTAFVLLSLVTIGYAIALGYYTPAIYSYNFFYGYFPGVTYDETLRLGWTLVLFRVVTLVVAASLAGTALVVLGTTHVTNSVWEKTRSCVNAIRRPPYLYGAAPVVMILAVAFIYRNELGFEAHRTFILRTLDKQWRTEHFTICYSHESYSNDEIRWIGAEHEFQLHQILNVLYLPFRGRIESYIYPSSDVKQHLIGAGPTDIAKPWSSQIHLTKQSLGAALKHELVHLLAAPFGVPVVRVSLSWGLLEGLAMAIERISGNRTLHQYAAALYRFGLAPPMKELMSFTGFAFHSSTVSYVLVGSFCRHLIDRYGIRKMMLVYGRGDYSTVYGRSLDELIAEWQGFLGRLSVTDPDRDAIDAFFRRPPIFQKVCARVLANRMMQARRMFERKEYTTAAALYRQSFEDGGAYEALSGYFASALRLRQFHVLSSALDTIILKDPLPTRYLPLFLIVGDAMWAEGKSEKAAEVYSRVIAADISDGFTEVASLRLHSMKDEANEGRLLSYFLSDLGDTLGLRTLDSIIYATPGDWVPLYLKAMVLQRLDRFQDAYDIAQSFNLADRDARLEAFRLRMDARALFRLKRFQEAKIPLWTSLNYYLTEGAEQHTREWVERCDWMSTHLFP